MTEVDARVFCLAALAGIATAAAPVVLGGWMIAAGLIAAGCAVRSVFRTEESDVTTAIVVGGLVVLLTLSHGHLAALATCAGVFAGAELAAMARRLGVDSDAPAAPELRATTTTIGVGLAAGLVVSAITAVKASAPVANVALAAIVLLGVALLVSRAWRASDG